MWNIRFWGHIKLALSDNNKGSRIVITTRIENVAPFNKESPSYHLYKLLPLPIEKVWELFCKKVFQHEGGHCLSKLVDFSCGIIERHEGVPLAIVTIAGLLSNKEKVVSEWFKCLDSLSSKLESNSHLLDITNLLSLSYFDLPHNLKACFLYFGMFLEDYIINCARLIQLWIAKGFVREKPMLALEGVANGYLNHLCCVLVAWCITWIISHVILVNNYGLTFSGVVFFWRRRHAWVGFLFLFIYLFILLFKKKKRRQHLRQTWRKKVASLFATKSAY